MTKSSVNLINKILGILLIFVAANAFAGGYYGLLGAKDIPIEWLRNSPFNSYFIPSVVLVVVVGGTSLFAGFAVLMKFRTGDIIAYTAGGILMVWLAVELFIIGYVSWMQTATAIVGVLIPSLAWLMQKGEK
jgi:uncharacterized membrane protein YidH (DUF202 family)